MDCTTIELTALIDRDQGLPGRFFTSEEVFALEQRAVFEKSWMCIGLSADVPSPGGLVPMNVLGRPLLLARDESSLRVFHNACSHRGAMLVETAAQGRPRIVCPYHSWTYKLDGELVATPHVGGAGVHHCAGFERAELGLRRVRSAEWGGFLFVNLSGTAPDFDAWIGPIADRLGRYGAADWRRDVSQSRTLDVAANWKIVVENFVESYHLPWVHHALNAVNPMALHYQILGGHSYLGQGGTGYQTDEVAGTSLPRVSGLEDYSSYESFFIFPNLILSPLPDMCFSIILTPAAAERTHERIDFYFVGEEALVERHAEARRRGADFILNVNTEDVGIVEAVQRGRHSPAFVGGRFAPLQEATSLQLQKIVAAKILAADGVAPETLVPLPQRDIFHPAPRPA